MNLSCTLPKAIVEHVCSFSSLSILFLSSCCFNKNSSRTSCFSILMARFNCSLCLNLCLSSLTSALDCWIIFLLFSLPSSQSLVLFREKVICASRASVYTFGLDASTWSTYENTLSGYLLCLSTLAVLRGSIFSSLPPGRWSPYWCFTNLDNAGKITDKRRITLPSSSLGWMRLS